ncbi:MAG: hypothetical protein QOD07_2460, partial [Frankiaceae bacterium]|nr:hypothetical protein [Frankiaceae bacterium]
GVFTFGNSGNTAQLAGLGTFTSNFAFFSASVTFPSSSMQLSADGTTVTITLGTLTGGTANTQNNSNQKSKATWAPGTGAHDLAGNSASTAAWTDPNQSRYF